MRILVTNDDGIFSEGLRYLVEFAQTLGEVIVVAPKREQSAKSQSINVKTGFTIEKINLFEGIESYMVDSTPSDCVRVAIYYLKLDFDMVFSGINNGYNAGEDILYSGTVAAATEGALINKPSLAFSTIYSSFEGKKFLKESFDYVMDNKLFEKHNFWNINIPPKARGIKITKQGLTNFDTFFENRDGLLYQLGDPHFEKETDEEADVKALNDDYISITPLTVDRTKHFNK